MTQEEKDSTQVIQHIDVGGKPVVRVYEIEDLHFATEDDPLTTIHLTGDFMDVEP